MTTINPIVQIRATLVDTATPSLLTTATGGTISYEDLYAANDEDAALTVRQAAGILAGYFAQQPSSVNGGGEGVAWDRSRYEFYAAIAAGRGGGLATSASPLTMVPVKGLTAQVDEYSR